MLFILNNYCKIKIKVNQTILATITPVIKPEREEAKSRPILKVKSLDSLETKSFNKLFIYYILTNN